MASSRRSPTAKIATCAGRVDLYRGFVDSGQGEGCVCRIQGGHHELDRLPANFGRLPTFGAGFFDQPSRALWLIKWLLLIPHYIILLFLWIAFWIVTVIAFFAILFTTGIRRACSSSTSG